MRSLKICGKMLIELKENICLFSRESLRNLSRVKNSYRAQHPHCQSKRAKHYHNTQGKEKENLPEVAKLFSNISDLVFLKKNWSFQMEIKKNKTSHRSSLSFRCRFRPTLKHTIGINSGDRSHDTFQGWVFY